MNENQVRALIQQQSQASTFNVPNVPFHVHNGVDAPIVYSPVNIYTGYVPSDADMSGAGTNGYVFFPQGWTASVDGTPVYEIVHNLNTDFYTVMICMTGPAFPLAFPATICLSNSFQVAFTTVGNTQVSADFHFQLIQVNNNYQTIPQYTAQGGVGA